MVNSYRPIILKGHYSEGLLFRRLWFQFGISTGLGLLGIWLGLVVEVEVTLWDLEWLGFWLALELVLTVNVSIQQ